MKYTDFKQQYKQARESWDENYEDWSNGSEFAWDATRVEQAIKESLKKHYARLLARAYKKSTGKVLKNPEQRIDPRYGYTIGRAANVDPKVLEQLNDYYRRRLGGWASKSYNVQPGLALDAVDVANSNEYAPLDYVTTPNIDPDSTYTATTKIKATY